MLFKNRKSYVLNFALTLALLGGLFGLVPVEDVHAATHTVTNTNDSGAESLRQAIADAASGDIITFDPSLADQTITLASDLVINKDLVIDGSELSSQVTISGGNISHLEISLSKVVRISDITLTNGYTTGNGGAIFSSGDLTLINATLRNNHAVGGGGAIYATRLTLKNSTLYQNQADSDGGAIFIAGNANSTIVNSTIRQNQAGGSGGGISVAGNTYVEVFNSTFAGNSASGGSELMLSGNTDVNLSNTILACIPGNTGCIIQIGNITISSPNSIIDTGPLADFGLVELADNGGPTQTMALLPGSPLIDAGDNTICANTPVNNLDQRGFSRPQGTHCDIGAYEDQFIVRYVKQDATGTSDGSSWTNAHTDLQSALVAASPDEEIWVAAGTYKPTSTTDRTISFNLKNGVAVYGGFAGAETSRDQRDYKANPTILSGDIGAVEDNSDNSYHVVVGSNTNNSAILDGFTVTGGNANGFSSYADYGGGLLILGGNPMLANLTLSGNSAYQGGGMANYSNSSPSIANVTISGNSAIAVGGGIYNSFNSDPTLMNVTLSNNSTSHSGGGIYNLDSNPTLTNVTLNGNVATYGAGIFNNTSNPTLTNVTLNGNSATSYGGGVYNYFHSDPILNNVTVSGNSAPHGGGGIYNGESSNPAIYNTILWGNGSQIDNPGLSTTMIKDSIVQNGCPTRATCTDIINSDPLLGSLQDNGGPTQTMALGTGSAAIDAGGVNASCAATDQRGVTRPQSIACDIGAYEHEHEFIEVLYVKPSSLTTGVCESWIHACELRYALSRATARQQIWVAAGTYEPTSGADRTISFALKHRVEMYGGFAGTETLLTERDPKTNLTILSGDLNGDDSGFTNNGENSYHVVVGSANYGTAVLDGFTITGGNANGSEPNNNGGGLYNYYFGSPKLVNVIIRGNSAAQYGGGVYNDTHSNPALTNVTISGNSAMRGGGIYNEHSSPTLTSVTINGNSAVDGGGMYNLIVGSQPTLTNVTISNNVATSTGGGMSNVARSLPKLTNVTINGNSAPQGGGLYNSDSGPILTNVILWGNGAAMTNLGTRAPTVNDSVVQGGCPSAASCTNVIDADPLLGVLQDNGGFTQTMALGASSPAIDAGNDTSCPTTDQRGVARPQSSHCDIGAYEYDGSIIPTVTSTPTYTPTFTPSPTFTPTGTPTETSTPTNAPTMSPTPVTSCDQITAGPITKSGNSMSMTLTSPLTVPIQIQDVFVVWNHDKGHEIGSDKTLKLNSVSLGSQFWSGTSNGPSLTITPSPTTYIPSGTSTITFAFHQSYEFFDGTEQIIINLATNGCQSHPVISTYTATATPTNTFTPTATPPYSYNPLYLSLTGNQTIDGVASADEDILRFDGANWSLFFDGSDVGVGGSDLFGFSFIDSDSMLMSFSANVTVNGISATPQDILRFDAASLGSITSGVWSMYFDGSDVGLDTTAEKIDSVSLLPDGRVLISTTGNPVVAGVTGAKDEDVLVFTPTSLGDVTSGSWAMYFDGSDVGLAETSGEDVDALDVVGGKVYLSTADTFSVNGVSGADEDVFICEPTALGDVTACNYSSSLYFDGSTWGLTANDVDAFNFLATGPIPTNTPTHTPTNTPTNTPTATLGHSPTPTYTPTATATFTPTATNTPGSSDLIFADSFEAGNLLAWTSSTIDLGDLSASAASALVGNQGVQAVIDDNNTIYVTDDSPNAEPTYRARFYFDPNSIPMLSGDAHFIFKGFMGTSTEMLRTEFRQSAGAYQLRISLLDDGTTWVNSNWFTISDASHFIELGWRAATAVGANNGALTFWIDGILQADLSAVDNDTRRMDRVRLGALTGVDNGTRGTYYFDAFESHRQTYIGP